MLRDVVRIWFFFFSISDTLHLVYWSCDHFDIHCTYICFIYYWGMFFHLSFHVLSLFYLYTHVSYIMYAIFYFCFTLRCLDEFCLKVFQKYRLSKSTCHKLFSCKVFQEFVLGYILLYSTTMNMSWVIFDFSHISFVCCGFVTDCQRGRLLGHMCFTY